MRCAQFSLATVIAGFKQMGISKFEGKPVEEMSEEVGVRIYGRMRRAQRSGRQMTAAQLSSDRLTHVRLR